MQNSRLLYTLGVLALPLTLLFSQPGCSDDDELPDPTGTPGGSAFTLAAKSDRGFTLDVPNTAGLAGLGRFDFRRGDLGVVHEALAATNVSVSFEADGGIVFATEAGVARATLAFDLADGAQGCTAQVTSSEIAGLVSGETLAWACEGIVTNPLRMPMGPGATGPVSVTLSFRAAEASAGAWAHSVPVKAEATALDGDAPAIEIHGGRLQLR